MQLLSTAFTVISLGVNAETSTDTWKSLAEFFTSDTPLLDVWRETILGLG